MTSPEIVYAGVVIGILILFIVALIKQSRTRKKEN